MTPEEQAQQAENLRRQVEEANRQAALRAANRSGR